MRGIRLRVIVSGSILWLRMRKGESDNENSHALRVFPRSSSLSVFPPTPLLRSFLSSPGTGPLDPVGDSATRNLQQPKAR